MKLITSAVLGAAIAWGSVQAREKLWGGPTGLAITDPAAVSAGTTPATTTPAVPSAPTRLVRVNKALMDVKAMQQAARDLSNGVVKGVPAATNLIDPTNHALDVPLNSWDQINGLVTAKGASKFWVGADQPVETPQAVDGGLSTNVTIKQTQQQALLTWETFNVGKNTNLVFDQAAGGSNASQWIAFNYVRDPTGAPSQILGQIKTVGVPDAKGAEQVGGQVYVMNANGIIFGGSSQVNAHGLVASSLPINYNLVQRGLLNNPDAQFLFSALPVPGGGKGPSPAFDPGTASDGLGPMQTPLTASGAYGDVVVQAGAQLTAPTNADHIGGRIALVGPNVTNAGTISTPDGQSILAAGLQVAFAPHAAADPTLRGLDVYVGAVADPSSTVVANAGTATNAAVTDSSGVLSMGLISAPRGNVTITGKTVNQNGFIDSSTSVSYNGRVDLIAGFNAVPNPQLGAGTGTIFELPFVYASNAGHTAAGTAQANSGQVNFGKGSVLQIQPEDSSDRVAGDLALPSLVNIEGASVYFANDSTLFAPGAAVPPSTSVSTGKKPALSSDGSSLQAGVSIQAGNWVYDQVGQVGYQFLHTADEQQIFVDRGAAIDVAGMNVTAPVTENIVSVELRANELAGSPLQRDGILRGSTIQVDVRQHGPWVPSLNSGLGGYTWVGTPIADTSGWVGLNTHSVRELTTNGGSVALSAGGVVVVQSGATIDVSGGSVNFSAGDIVTTKLISSGHVYDIAQATADRKYDGIFNATTTTTDPKWGVTTSSTNPLTLSVHENAYVQGGNGGSLAITSPVMALDGTLRGNTTAGARQLTLSPVYDPANPPDAARPAQIGVPEWLLNATSMPTYGQLSLKVQRQVYVAVPRQTDGDTTPTDGADSLINNYLNFSPTPQNFVFKDNSTLTSDHPIAYDATGGYGFPADRKNEIDLAPLLVSNDLTSNPAASGFGILRVDDSGDNFGSSPGVGNITIKAGTNLTLPAGGSLNLQAGNIVVENGATVKLPGGALQLSAFDISSSLAGFVNSLTGQAEFLPAAQVPKYTTDRGNITIGNGAVLDTSGNVVNLIPGTDGGILATVITGGSISLSGSDVKLADEIVQQNGNVLPTSTLDVSGGATVSATGKLAYGAAGKIALSAGRALGSGFGSVVGGRLGITGAILKGYAGAGRSGGALSLQATSLSIKELSTLGVALTDSVTGGLSLAPEFFNEGGFSKFDLTGLGLAVDSTGHTTGPTSAFVIEALAVIDPQIQSWQFLPGGSVYTPQRELQQAASFNFKASDELFDVFPKSLGNDTTLTLGPGAVISANSSGSVTLGGAAVDVLGSVIAHGGQIAIKATGNDESLRYSDKSVPTLHLGEKSLLDVSGIAAFGTDVTGVHKTDVLDGGLIAVDGNIVAEKGAVLNASGADDMVQVAVGQPVDNLPSASLFNLVAVEKQSNGGGITLTGEKILLTNATLLGGAGKNAAGSSMAQGGNLTVVSNRAATGRDDQNGVSLAPDEVIMKVAAQNPDFVYAGFGQTVTAKSGEALGDTEGLGQIWFGVGSVASGDFGALTFSTSKGAFQVQGNVSLVANRQINFANGGVLAFASDPNSPLVASSLNVSAPYVAMGMPFVGPQQPGEISSPFGNNVVSAGYGAGLLSVNASSLIDVGNVVLQNAGVAKLDATYNGQSGTTAGAIRGDGTLDIAGALTLKAGEIYPPTATTFKIIASNYLVDATEKSGSVTIQSSGISSKPPLPLSAGGSLEIYSSVIDQGGLLRAPLGSIALGVGTAGGTDPFSGGALPVTSSLTLRAGSVTSVSAVNDAGKALTVPYGINVNGGTWVDPTGMNITAPLTKQVELTADAIDFQSGTLDPGGTAKPAAAIDISGGGDLLAYRFVPGAGGKADVLAANSGSFAVLPGYTDAYAPYAPYDLSSAAKANLGIDLGYSISGNAGFGTPLRVGDQIHLEGGGGLAAGNYTILPARYALLSGAFLVTPQSARLTSGSVASLMLPVGSTAVSGYRYNGFASAGNVQSLFSAFEVAPQNVVLKRAEYDQSLANAYFTTAANTNNRAVPRLPIDAGQLVFAAGSALDFKGAVDAQGGTNGRGGIIDISSSTDILIGSRAVIAGLENSGASGKILLDSAELSGFGAESLLIGGVRSSGANGTVASVVANNITVDNAGEALTGSDVILAANESLTLKNGAEVGKANQPVVTADPLSITGGTTLKEVGAEIVFSRNGASVGLPQGTGAGQLTASSSGFFTTADGAKTTFFATAPDSGLDNAFTVPAGATITLDQAGKITFAASNDVMVKSIPLTFGDGTLLRVSSDPNATISRTGVASWDRPVVTLGAGVTLAGAGAIIDATNVTHLDSKVDLSAIHALSLSSGTVSVLLDHPGAVTTAGSLVLSREAQQSLFRSASTLSLLSYSSLDLYGTGVFGSSTLDSLAFHAGAIRGYLNSSDPAAKVTVSAKTITLDNPAGAAAPETSGSATGTLSFDTGTLHLGGNLLEVQNFDLVAINATGGVLTGDNSKQAAQSGGLLVRAGDIAITTPLLAGVGATDQSITAEGGLALSSGTGTATITPGLGAKLAFTAKTIDVGTTVRLPSGTVSMEATTGDLKITAGTLDVGGTEQHFYDVTKYTDGGTITLSADQGNMSIAAGSKISVAANSAGGSAGTLDVSASHGKFDIADNTLSGGAGQGAMGGAFSLDAAGISGSDPAANYLGSLSLALLEGGFNRSVAVRIRNGDVIADGAIRAHDIALAADQGSITVTGSMDASGLTGATRAGQLAGVMNPADPTGGTIDLSASGNVALTANAWLTVEGFAYNNAGKGGAITLSAGNYTGQVNPDAHVDIQPGARLDLGVLHVFTPNDLLLNPGLALQVSARTDLFAGTLHLRETQTAFGNGVQFAHLGDQVNGASSVVLEGYQVFNVSNTDGAISTTGAITNVGSGSVIDSSVKTAVNANGAAFVAGLDPNLLSNPLLHVRPGAEIVNDVATDGTITGDLTLANTWNLSGSRFGANNEPGNLTIRTGGNLIFNFGASLSDGFDPTNPVTATYPLWTAQLQTGQSWSYRLVAGADMSAADSKRVQSLSSLAVDSGSLLLGQGSQALPASGTRASIVRQYYQTIRTGTGDIDISAGRDVQLLNPLATIYTAGRAAKALAGFDLPVLDLGSFGSSPSSIPYYSAQYSLQGGNVNIHAQHDIARYIPDDSGVLVPDSSQELPSNWLYRRGTIGADGNYSVVALNALRNTEIQSTSWWVDFSNFFSDVGALGGGQVNLNAGHSVANVNASVATNARMPYQNSAGLALTPSAANLVELGGGDLTVNAGADINGGVYYVERGNAALRAGNEVTTNATRLIEVGSDASVKIQWLPTTFFLGKGRIQVAAGNDVTVGGVANPFLLPAGAGNRAYEKSFFSTYDAASSVAISSLAGTITLEDQPDIGSTGLLGWYQNVLYNDGRSTAAATRPWLRLLEDNFDGFGTVAGLFPGTLRATTFGGDIDLIGRLTLAPSANGTVDLLTAGNINGLQPNGISGGTLQWGSAAITLSDADPKRMPDVITPVSYLDYPSKVKAGNTALALAPLNALFADDGATNLTLEQKLAQHGQTMDEQGHLVPLHFHDSDPIHLYATGGDISGLTLYAGKPTRVVAENDITDVSFYLQNQKASDVSLIAAGHDIVAYDPVSPLRLAAQKDGNILPGDVPGATGPASGRANAGDFQVAGPGTLQVLAGNNINLGSGNDPATDGTAVGITTVGAARNPYLPQNSGSNIVAAAGVGSIYTPDSAALGSTPGLATTSLKFTSFIAQFLDPSTAGNEAVRYLPQLGSLMGLTTTDRFEIWTDFGFQTGQPLTERQANLVLGVFQLVLRDAARDRNNPDNVNFGKYTNGFAAISALLPGSPEPTAEDLKSTVPVIRPAGSWLGNLSMATREVKTIEGGNISLLVPGGDITVGRGTDPQKADQGVLTERGGSISIFAADNVNVGTSRIFTLRGGNEIVWSTWGNIAAGSGSKTVFSAPPTRVLVDPQSGDVQNDLAGLATGSGIGVLATLSGVKPGDVDLIAPVGTIDAGDAGIRSSGNLNLAARVVLNASNIQVGGSSAGIPPPPPAPNLGSLTAASTASAGASSAATDVAKQSAATGQVTELPSLISVEVLGYGGDDDDEDDGKKKAPASLSESAHVISTPVRV